jgi:hypothetical protein
MVAARDVAGRTGHSRWARRAGPHGGRGGASELRVPSDVPEEKLDFAVEGIEEWTPNSQG